MSIVNRSKSDIVIPYDIIDSSMVEIIRELNDIGLVTVGSCSGLDSEHDIHKSGTYISCLVPCVGFAFPLDITEQEFIDILQDVVNNTNIILKNEYGFENDEWLICSGKTYTVKVLLTTGEDDDIRYVLLTGTSSKTDEKKMTSIQILMEVIRNRFQPKFKSMDMSQYDISSI